MAPDMPRGSASGAFALVALLVSTTPLGASSPGAQHAERGSTPTPADGGVGDARWHAQLLVGMEGSTEAGGPLSGGGTLRLAVGERLRGVAGAGFLATSTVEAGVYSARLERYPFLLGLTWETRHTQFAWSVEAGARGAILVVESPGIPDARTSVRWSMAGALALGLRLYTGGPVNPIALLQLTVEPLPYQLEVQGSGVVGTLPATWLGLWLGGTFDLTAPFK